MDEEKKKIEEMAEQKPDGEEKIEEKVETEAETKPEPTEEAQPAETHAAEEGAGAEEEPKPEAQQESEPEPEAQPEAEQKQPRMFTQEQVNELVGKARAEGRERGYRQAKDEALHRYGVESDDELDTIFADGSRFGELRARNADSESRYKDAMAELALVKSGILPSRQSDVRAILAANGLDVTEENIASMVATHPEWVKEAIEQTLEQGGAQPAPIPQPKPVQDEGKQSLGLEPKPKQKEGEEDEKERVMKNLFRL